MSTDSAGITGRASHTPETRNSTYFDRIQRIEHQSASQPLAIAQPKRLLHFLRDARRQRSKQESEEFALIYNLSGDERAVPQPFAIYRQQTEHRRGSCNQLCNQLLFLSGYPSALLLEEIGDHFDVDPKFFDSHLSFVGDNATSCDIHPSHHKLPSRQHTVFQTSVPTIGGIHGDSKYDSLSLKRDSFTSQMQDYLHNLKLGKLWEPFDSLVRDVEVHDTYRFSLEQSVTILIKHQKEDLSNWLVIVWSDAGADLLKSPPGPWLESTYAPFNTHFRPIYLESLDAAHESYTYSRHSNSQNTQIMPQQSIQLVAKTYGTTLNPARMATEPIYLLSELLAFIAASETCYLDMAKSVLDDNIPLTHTGTAKTHQDIRVTLVFSYRTLERRRDRVAAMLEFLESNGVSHRDVSKHHDMLQGNELAYIRRDFEYLLDTIDRLKERCDHELSVIMSEAAVKDAEWNKNQSMSSQKFALLATIYVPLSFTCSLFGMNFVIFDSLKKGFSAWLALSLPLLMLTIALLIWDTKYTARVVENFKPSHKYRDR